jgi:5,10-methylenetetrahydromethanopterin reductase
LSGPGSCPLPDELRRTKGVLNIGGDTRSQVGILLNAEFPHRLLMDVARRIEELDLGTLWYGDERFYYETFTGLAAVALQTSKIRIGPAVCDPYTRHPAITAAAMASLDELSQGRSVLGYGAGASGFEILGIGRTRPVATLRESIELMRRLWRGEHVTSAGPEIPVTDAYLKIPARELEIYLAADGPQLLRLAGAAADAAITSHCVSARILAPRVDVIREGARHAGRAASPKIVARVDISIDRDRATAFHVAKVRIGRYLWARYPNIAYLEQHGLELPAELDRRLRAAGPFRRTHELEFFRPFVDAIPDDLVTPLALVGTPDDVGAQLARMFGGGVDEVMAYPITAEPDPRECISLLAEAASSVASTVGAV